MEKDSIGFKLGEILFETVNGPGGKHKALRDAVIEAAREQVRLMILYRDTHGDAYEEIADELDKKMQQNDKDLIDAVKALNKYEEVGE
jgi:hypothetical protein